MIAAVETTRLVSTGLLGCALIAVLLIPGCGRRPGGPDEALREEAARLARELIIVDTHIDLPYRFAEKPEDVSVRTAGGDFDYPRARAGGLDAAFMSIYVPASYQEGGAREFADSLIDMVETLARDRPGMFALARSPDEVRALAGGERVALPMGMENGAPLGEDLGLLRHFFDRGIRYITLTHSENNAICDSSYAKERRWSGLSPFGRRVVAEMNRLGIMIDVSHVSDETFRQVISLSRAPVIASHSSCRRFTPGWERNIDDDMIRALAAKGGVVQINFGSAFLTDEARSQSEAYYAALKEHMAREGLGEHDEGTKAFSKRYWEEHDRVYADVKDVVDHIDHVVRLAGAGHVGFGSDFEGVGDSLPAGLKDVSDYPNLILEMLRRGYSKEDIRGICGENVLRVWSQVERVARDLSAAPAGPDPS